MANYKNFEKVRNLQYKAHVFCPILLFKAFIQALNCVLGRHLGFIRETESATKSSKNFVIFFIKGYPTRQF